MFSDAETSSTNTGNAVFIEGSKMWLTKIDIRRGNGLPDRFVGEGGRDSIVAAVFSELIWINQNMTVFLSDFSLWTIE